MGRLAGLHADDSTTFLDGQVLSRAFDPGSSSPSLRPSRPLRLKLYFSVVLLESIHIRTDSSLLTTVTRVASPMFSRALMAAEMFSWLSVVSEMSACATSHG